VVGLGKTTTLSKFESSEKEVVLLLFPVPIVPAGGGTNNSVPLLNSSAPISIVPFLAPPS